MERKTELIGVPVDVVKEDCIFRHQEIPKAHTDAITAVVMMEDSIYTGSRDRSLKRWKPVRNSKGRFEMKNDLEVPLSAPIWSLISVGEWLFCGLGTGEIKAFSKSGGEMKLEGHSKRVACMLVHEHVLMTAGADGCVRCWQMDPQRQVFACTHTITDDISGGIACMAVLNERLWVGTSSGVSVIELSTLKVVGQLNPKKSVAGLLQFEGHMIVIYSDGGVVIFNSNGERTHEQAPLKAGPVTAMGGLESGPRLLCGHAKGQVSTITLPMFNLKHYWQCVGRCKVTAMCCAGHDGIFLIGSENGNLQLWQRDENAPLAL